MELIQIRTLREKENNKNLGIWEANIIKQKEMTEIVRKQKLRRQKNHEIKLCSRNSIKEIIT